MEDTVCGKWWSATVFRQAEVTFLLSGPFLFLSLSAVIIRGENTEKLRQSECSELKVSVTHNHPYPRGFAVALTTTGSSAVYDGRKKKRRGKKRGKQVFRPFPAHTMGITATRTGTKYFHYAAMYFTGAYFVRRFCSIWIVNHDFLFPSPLLSPVPAWVMPVVLHFREMERRSKYLVFSVGLGKY